MNNLDIENELIESSKLFDTKDGETIKSFLKNKFDAIVQLFILHHHFGQAEEHYVLMVNGKYIVEMEVVDTEVLEYDAYEIKGYLLDNRKMPKHFKRRIEIARKLSSEH